MERSQIYATDINDLALGKAEDGIFALDGVAQAEHRYRQAGGRRTFSDYYVADHGFFRMNQHLRRHIAFAHHNLVSDGAFCEVQLVLCRNVLIYFDRQLQERVLRMLKGSLAPGGFLCMGTRESLRLAEAGAGYAVVDEQHRIFRRAEP